MAQADFKAARAVILNSIVLASNGINNISQAFSKSVLFLGPKDIKIQIEKNIEAVYSFSHFPYDGLPQKLFCRVLFIGQFAKSCIE